MSNYQTIWLPADFSFRLKSSGAKNKLSDATLESVESIWDSEQQRRGKKLFNGKVLSLIECDESGLVAEFVEYKQFLAYLREPSLRKELGIKPLSLSCFTHTSQSVLFGRRSKSVSQYPLWYELPPSGSFDPACVIGESIDVLGQALRELTEETGLLAADVQKMHSFALIDDAGTGLTEICVDITIVPDKDQSPLPSTPEYDTLQWVPRVDLTDFLQSHRIIPFSLYLLHQIK